MRNLIPDTYGAGVDTLHKVRSLFTREWELVILLLLVAALDSQRDVVIVPFTFAPRIEYLDDSHISVDRKPAFAGRQQLILVVNNICSAGHSWV